MQCVGEDVNLGVFPADQLPIHPDRFSFERHIHFLRLQAFYAAPAYSSRRTKKSHRKSAVACARSSTNYKPFFSTGAGLNPTERLALIFITAPVCGLRPLRALR